MVESKDFGTVLIDNNFNVYNVENFDFTGKTDYHAPEKIDIALSNNNRSPKCKSRKLSSVKNLSYLTVIKMESACSCGEIYVFVLFHISYPDIHVLKLNVEDSSWDVHCILEIHGLHQLLDVVVCTGNVYMVTSE